MNDIKSSITSLKCHCKDLKAILCRALIICTLGEEKEKKQKRKVAISFFQINRQKTLKTNAKIGSLFAESLILIPLVEMENIKALRKK